MCPLNKFQIVIPPQDVAAYPDCVAKLIEGDSEAYEWVYKNYSGKLYEYLKLLSSNSALAEDLVQEIFIKLWVQREKLVGVSHFNSYLYTAARNLLMDKWRREKLEADHMKQIAILQTRCTASNDFFRTHNEKQISEAVRQLPERQRLVYRLIREEGRTREEISKALKISPLTVKATMQNALRGLKEELRDKVEG